MNNEEDNRRSQSSNRMLLFIIIMYFLLYFASNNSEGEEDYKNKLISELKKGQTNHITVEQVLSSLTPYQLQGNWNSDIQQQNIFLFNQKGQFTCKVLKLSTQPKFRIYLYIKNGNYIDHGVTYAEIIVNASQWETVHEGSSIIAQPINTTIPSIIYRQEVLFDDSQIIQQNMTKLQVKMELDSYDNLIQKLQIEGFYGQGSQFSMTLAKQKSYFLGLLLLAILLLFIAIVEFSSVMKIFKSLIEGTEQSSNFSYWTMLIALMWDATFSVMAFLIAFNFEQSDQNLILFIIPAFIFCLLFTNIELRLLIEVYRTRFEAGTDLRGIFCKFNVLTYGSLLLIYPILIYTNLNNYFFILLSLFLLPQIYLNARNGKRPQPNSAYYRQFLLPRFLFILYLKCFPYNHFEFQPNYLEGFGCFGLVVCQFALLWVQRVYGPKKVLPACLLPPIYDYSCQNEINIQANTQKIECPICLSGLHEQVVEKDKIIEESVPYTIMQAPCGHRFHGYCLVSWMKIKMECPLCRDRMPPYE